ncbi:phage tail protein, partial [Salmonella enterica]|nr:phage tail protein [Salmonella enterica]
MTGNKYGSAAAVRREVAEYLRPPRRMPVAEGIKQFMFVPRGANTAVPWD